ncbi:DUF2752 domain-containing protein [Alienimonas chondri]|uniref:DUF2752 domain-containing protein n=1 Tax=Alienimonas chondri TaxID=2681879 RepID=A0ABX1VIX2_9PLAN|nr:DUF2752 domain-containing protein [Alienimonas chondri]NNJ27795.1 hypothetical protein [Alienimonas chondri]
MNEAAPADSPSSAPDAVPHDRLPEGRAANDGLLTRSGRATAAVVAAGLVVGFSIAAYLTPSSAGLGTHQQLGLPPCTVRVLTGHPCPACGMTTSFSHFVRGQWGGSLSANSGGFLLALMCLALIPILLRAAFTGRLAFPRLGRWGSGDAARPEWWGVLGLSTVGFVTLIDWAFRLAE